MTKSFKNNKVKAMKRKRVTLTSLLTQQSAKGYACKVKEQMNEMEKRSRRKRQECAKQKDPGQDTEKREIAAKG